MRGDTPAIVLPGEDEPTKLKTPPSVCTICGGKFIRTDRRQKYCPDCRKEVYGRKSLSKKKREKDLAYAFGEKADDDKEDHVEGEKDKTTGGETLEKISQDVEEKRVELMLEEEKRRMLDGMIKAIEEQFGCHLINADELLPVEITVGGKLFQGAYIQRRTWEGGDDDQD